MNLKDTNKIIWIDLATNNVDVKDIPEDLIKMYLGGRGINSWLLNQYSSSETDPLGPENLLIVGTGMLTGLKGLTFSRTTITSKSPESGLFGDANIGGGFGVNLRKNGYGYVVLVNKASSPKIVVINKDSITIEEAGHLWGKDTQDTQHDICKSYPKSESLCIGPAGENQVAYACVINRKKNAAARCGMGAVMGSKNIKAIVAAHSEEELNVENETEFKESVRKINNYLRDEFLSDRLKEFGSSHLYEIINESIGFGRVRNGRTLAFPENENFNHEKLKKYHTKRSGCQNCIIGCHFEYEYKNIRNEGPDYGVIAHFGPVLGITRLEATLVLNDVANRLGIDVSSSANIMAWMIELYQEKIIDKSITNGIELNWNDASLVKSLLEQIAKREGFGNFLADGPKNMLSSLPKDAEKYLCWTKKLVQSDPADLRYLPAFALGNSVASRGSDHLRSRPIWVAFEFPAEDTKDVYGKVLNSEAMSYKDKHEIVYWWEHYLAIFDLLGLCKFMAFHSLPPGIQFSYFTELIKSILGIDFTEEEIKTIGERVINIERQCIIREGIGRNDDYPNERVFSKLKDTDGVREEDLEIALDKDKYTQMLDHYYVIRGWDSDGRITDETKKRLSLDKTILL